jgi:predicted nucleic acid-binding protein
MPTEFFDDATIDELLSLAGVSTEHSAARRWLKSALAAARGTLEPRLVVTGATHVPQPSPAKHNAPLDKIERARLIAALEQLRRHPYAHASFWRFEAFGPVNANEFERADVIPTLTNIRDAARKARVSKTGRPRNFRKQQIVDLALAFCARFSPKKPSNDVNNFFPCFAERFFELSTERQSTDRATESPGRSRWR